MKSILKKLGRKQQTDIAAPTPSDDELVNPFEPYSELSEQADSEMNVGGVTDALSSDFDSSQEEFDPELLAAEKKDSRFKTLLNAIPKPSIGANFQLLAFQAGSFGLRGVLIKDAKYSAIPVAVAESRNVDFTRAIAEVIEKLKKQHKRLPKQAILITPSVVSSMVELPVSPLRPRSDEEMQELIRWELEGTLTQQNKHWLIGSMLVERGYLTPSQRDELVEELKVRQGQGGQDGLVRFGDLAVKLKYITQEQLEECFILQGKLIAVDDDLAYGWQAEEPQLNQGLSDEVLLSAADDDGSAHKWLVSGMSKAVRRRWVGAFNLNGIKVQAFYPAVGSGFAALAQRCLDEEQALLEVHQEQLAFISGHPGSVQEIRVGERQQGAIRSSDLQALLGVLPADLNALYINAPQDDVEDLLFTLSTVTTVEGQLLEIDYPELINLDNISLNALTGAIGAADHFLKHVQRARLSWIAARDAEVSFLKRILTPKVLLSTAVVIVISGMLGFLGWMHWNMWLQNDRLAQLEAKFEKDSGLKRQFSSITAAQKQLKVDIATARQEQAANAELLEALTEDSTRERLLVSLLLKALSIVTPDTVYIESLNRNDSEIVLKAFASSGSEGQLFINALNKVLKPAYYEVKGSDVTQGSDTEQDLYSISIVIASKATVANLVTK